MPIGPYLSPYPKSKSKLIKDLNIKAGNLKLIGETLGNDLEHIGARDNFLNNIPITQPLT